MSIPKGATTTELELKCVYAYRCKLQKYDMEGGGGDVRVILAPVKFSSAAGAGEDLWLFEWKGRCVAKLWSIAWVLEQPVVDTLIKPPLRLSARYTQEEISSFVKQVMTSTAMVV